MEKNFQIVKRENESLEKIDKRPVLLVNDIAKLVNSSALIKPQYKSVKFGDQVWMTENLNVDHYRNGDVIPEVQGPKEWSQLKTGAWCYYDNDPENGKKYGKLYNWYAVNDPRGLAPEGWHIPAGEELEVLQYAADNNGNTLKAKGEGEDEGLGTNESGLSLTAGGYRFIKGNFSCIGSYAHIWSTTEYDSTSANGLYLWYHNELVGLCSDFKEYGFSIRCVND